MKNRSISKHRAAIALGAGMIALAAPGAARAATDTDTFQVTATVIASCTVDADDLAFGNYDPVAGAPLDGTTTLDIHCTNGTAYDVFLDAGTGAGATIATRRMTSGANTLDYSLYQNVARTTLWGETEDTDTVPGTGDGAVQTLTIYGRAPINQTAPAGPYADTITVTVEY